MKNYKSRHHVYIEMGQLQPRASTQTWCKWRENANQERRTGRLCPDVNAARASPRTPACLVAN